MEATGLHEQRGLRNVWEQERKEATEVERESKKLVTELVQQQKMLQADIVTLKTNVLELEKQLAQN